MRRTKAKQLLREANELGAVDPRKSLVMDIHRNGMHTLRHLPKSIRRIYQDSKKGGR